MDPITINKLLSVADAIDTHRTDNQLSLNTFYKIIDIESRGKIKDLDRRVKDILRIFKESQWMTQREGKSDILYLTEKYHSFIDAWNIGNQLLPMNEGLTNYSPYASFLKCLKDQGQIKIPEHHNKEAKKTLGVSLKERYNITFVAFDTFYPWAISVGHAYRSPFEEFLYWGGEWDKNKPSLENFKEICLKKYNQTDKTSAYANLGRLAHLVCQELRISFQAFEMKMNQLLETFPGEITLAPATIRRVISGKNQIITIRPRNEILGKRLSTELLGRKQTEERSENNRQKSQWLEYRYLEDGMRVKGSLVKLVRWE